MVAIVVVQRVVVTIMCDAQGVRCHAGGDGDRAGALEMEIKGAKEERAIPCHIIIACDVYPFLCILFCLCATVAL